MPPLIDAYLKQAEPLIQTYQKDLYKLANKGLVIYLNNAEIHLWIQFQVEIFTQIRFVPANEIVAQSANGVIAQSANGVIAQSVNRAVAQSANEVAAQSANGAIERSAGGKKGPPTFVEALNLVDFVLLYNARLKDVVLQALLAEIALQDGKSTLTRKVNRLTTLKNGLEAFSEVVEKVRAYYSATALGLLPEVDLPPLEEIKKAKDNIHVLKNKLAVGELSTWINDYCVDGFKVNDDAIICTILGLSEDVSAGLSQLDPWMRAHEPLLYYIKKAIDAVTEEKSADNTTLSKDSLLTSLHSFGFTLNTAATICRNIPDDIVDLQTPAFWARRYLDHAYTYHPLLKTCPRYPYCPDRIDKLFTQDLTQQASEKHVQVPMINVSSGDSVGKTLVAEILAQLLGPEDEQYQLLFHGTTHKNAVSIITDGIILTAGEKKQDFSSGDGFYLSEDFENASVWRRAGRGEHQAVVVYKIKRSLLHAEEQNGLDLAQNRSQWEEVVLCCRNGYNDRKYKKSLNGVTFIRGPLCINPQRLGRERPNVFGRGDMQLCIRDEEYSETFGNLENIGCVVFY